MALRGVRVYNLSTGVHTVFPSGSTDDVAFSPDGDKVAAALVFDGIAVVSLSSGTELWSNSSHRSVSVAYSPDGTRVASGDLRGNIIIWDAATGALVLSITGGHTDRVRSLTYTLDGGRLISVTDDTVVVWDTTTGAVLKTLTDHTSDAHTPQRCHQMVSTLRHTIITGDFGSSAMLLLWNDLTPTTPPTPAPATPDVPLVPCPSGAGSHCRAHLAKVSEKPSRIAVSHDDTLVAVVGSDRYQVYNVTTGAALTVPSYPKRRVRRCVLA